MTTAFEGNLFPAPPQQKRPDSSRHDSFASTTSQKNENGLVPSPVRTSRSSGVNELATLSDVRVVVEYVTCLKKSLLQERRQREKEVADLKQQIQRVQGDFTAMKNRELEKLAVLQHSFDQLKDCPQAVASIQKQMDGIDRTMTDFRSSMSIIAGDIDYDRLRKWKEPPRLDLIDDEGWNAQCVFVLDANRPNVYEVDGTAYLKLQHGRPMQNITFCSDSNLSFVLAIEKTFSGILQSRTWMPLACQKKHSRSQNSLCLSRLSQKDCNSGLWNRRFLEEHCVTYDLHGRAHIYLALQNDVLSLAEIQNLVIPNISTVNHISQPISAGTKNSCIYPMDSSNFAMFERMSDPRSPRLQSSFSSSTSEKNEFSRPSGSIVRRKPKPKLSADSFGISHRFPPPGPPPDSPPPTPPAWAGLHFTPPTLPNMTLTYPPPPFPRSIDDVVVVVEPQTPHRGTVLPKHARSATSLPPPKHVEDEDGKRATSVSVANENVQTPMKSMSLRGWTRCGKRKGSIKRRKSNAAEYKQAASMGSNANMPKYVDTLGLGDPVRSSSTTSLGFMSMVNSALPDMDELYGQQQPIKDGSAKKSFWGRNKTK